MTEKLYNALLDFKAVLSQINTSKESDDKSDDEKSDDEKSDDEKSDDQKSDDENDTISGTLESVSTSQTDNCDQNGISYSPYFIGTGGAYQVGDHNAYGVRYVDMPEELQSQDTKISSFGNKSGELCWLIKNARQTENSDTDWDARPLYKLLLANAMLKDDIQNFEVTDMVVGVATDGA